MLALVKVGGYEALYKGYLEAVPAVVNSSIALNTTCGHPPEKSWFMLRGPTDPDMPWPGFLLGQTPASIWYWCADQVSYFTPNSFALFVLLIECSQTVHC